MNKSTVALLVGGTSLITLVILGLLSIILKVFVSPEIFSLLLVVSVVVLILGDIGRVNEKK